MKKVSKADWDNFCQLVKHERRYHFHHIKIKDDPFLYALSVIEEIAHKLCDHPLTLVTGTELYRCRPNPEKFETSNYFKELGPPPSHSARANRMSASGISMLYLADSQITALKETADKDGNFGVAKFLLKREMVVLDLTDFSKIDDTNIVEFLESVVEDMTKPIERDDKVHIEYIPTQIFTELFSYNWSDTHNHLIEGLKFPSARNNGEPSYVIFYNQKNFLDESAPFELVNFELVEHELDK